MICNTDWSEFRKKPKRLKAKSHGYIINGKRVSRKEFMKHKRVGGNGVAMTTHTTYQAHKPLPSESSGVLPSQVSEARALVQKEGLTGVNVHDNGCVSFTSRGDAGRRGWMKARHLVDWDGGYGDTYERRPADR